MSRIIGPCICTAAEAWGGSGGGGGGGGEYAHWSLISMKRCMSAYVLGDGFDATSDRVRPLGPSHLSFMVDGMVPINSRRLWRRRRRRQSSRDTRLHTPSRSHIIIVKTSKVPDTPLEDDYAYRSMSLFSLNRFISLGLWRRLSFLSAV